MFQDYLFYGCDMDMRYAFRMCHLSGVVEQARLAHGLSAQRAALLGEVLLGGVLLSSLLDEEERINLRFQLGPEFTSASETTRHAETKGYIEFADDSFIAQGVDDGFRFHGPLTVRSLRVNPTSGKVFEGVTQLTTSCIEDALNDHLKQSFQVKAGVRLAAWCEEDRVRAFGAVFLELPKLAGPVAEELWTHVNSLGSVKELFLKSDDPDKLANALIPHAVRAIKSVNPTWKCSCSEASVRSMLRSLPASDRQEMVAKGEPVEIRCHYCSTLYRVEPTSI